MKILITNRSLSVPGGSETYYYSLVEELVSLGHDVQGMCSKKPGFFAEKIKLLGVKIHDKPIKGKFDLVLSSHLCTIDMMSEISGLKIQTCHGIFPEPEQPSNRVDRHVSISEEVRLHLSNLGFESTIIHNGINCERFKPIKPLNKKLKKVLSLAHDDETNKIIKKSCDILDVEFFEINKYKTSEWNVESMINESDLVVTLGRGAYESMSCGRNVVIFDKRRYTKLPAIGDGFVDVTNVNDFIKNNCSGRFSKKKFDENSLVTEFQKYDVKHGNDLRNFALENLNIKNQTQKYLSLLG
jgi:glycosyltransferase involved in cell wall biosynthesis